MVETFRISVGPATVLLYAHPDQTSGDSEGDYLAKNIALINTSATQTVVYIGGTNALDPTSGARWIPEAGRSLSVNLEPGESLYAVCDSGGMTQTIDVLVNGR